MNEKFEVALRNHKECGNKTTARALFAVINSADTTTSVAMYRAAEKVVDMAKANQLARPDYAAKATDGSISGAWFATRKEAEDYGKRIFCDEYAGVKVL